jgi:putative transposase
LKSFDYTGLYRYSLTFCCYRRQRLFTDAAVVDCVLSQFQHIATKEQFAIAAYCFMPDHVHLLVEGVSKHSDCLRFISRAKQRSGFRYAQSRNNRLWQRYGYEHVLRNDESTMTVARYILENPVRAGLVKRVEDYPFSGSCEYPLQAILEAVADAIRGTEFVRLKPD